MKRPPPFFPVKAFSKHENKARPRRQTKYQLFAKTGDAAPTADIHDTKWNEWHTVTIPDIEVKDGTCTVGVTMDAAPGTWGSLDEFEFYRQE